MGKAVSHAAGRSPSRSFLTRMQNFPAFGFPIRRYVHFRSAPRGLFRGRTFAQMRLETWKCRCRLGCYVLGFGMFRFCVDKKRFWFFLSLIDC